MKKIILRKYAATNETIEVLEQEANEFENQGYSLVQVINLRRAYVAVYRYTKGKAPFSSGDPLGITDFGSG